jgi:hypothetical protein
MYISSPQVIQNSGQTQISVLVESSQGKARLWYSVNRAHSEFLTVENSDAFLVGLLILAMKDKEDIYIDGLISERLYYNLTHYAMKILTLLNPSLSKIKIFPKGLNFHQISQDAEGVATGFSGGIDSFCALIDHNDEATPKHYQITHLVLNNVGSHGRGERELFNKRYNRLSGIAQERNLPLIKIDSNLHDILQMNFQNTHITRNISAALLLQKLFGKYYYASAHKYEDCIIRESPDGAVIDPAAVHLFSTETTECISTGCQYSRIEKTIMVSQFEPSYRYLDVCVNAVERAENCSQCWKCARTLLTLEILGKHRLYNKVFDLEKFYQIRSDYIESIRQSQSPLAREVLDLAEEQSYDLSRIKL